MTKNSTLVNDISVAPDVAPSQKCDISWFPVHVHSYKIIDEDKWRTFIFRFPSEESLPDKAFDDFRYINEGDILEKLAEVQFKCLGASVQHMFTEFTTLADYFEQDELLVAASDKELKSEWLYFELKCDHWTLNEVQ